MMLTSTILITQKDESAEKAVFRTYHVLVHMADFEGISLSDVGESCIN